MATLFVHPLVPVACRMGAGSAHISNRLLICAMIASVLPDADVIAFYFGIPYSSPWGHRGWTHSIAFALLIGALGVAVAARLQASRWACFTLLSVSTASHGFLDAMTNGGLGIAFFWPFTDDRYFLPWQPIEGSPIGAARFFSQRGLEVLQSELVWVVLPILSVGLAALAIRRAISHQA